MATICRHFVVIPIGLCTFSSIQYCIFSRKTNYPLYWLSLETVIFFYSTNEPKLRFPLCKNSMELQWQCIVALPIGIDVLYLNEDFQHFVAIPRLQYYREQIFQHHEKTFWYELDPFVYLIFPNNCVESFFNMSGCMYLYSKLIYNFWNMLHDSSCWFW